jgi:hypothetical protein
MGPTMIRCATAAAGVAIVATLLLVVLGALGSGLGFGPVCYTVDATAGFVKIAPAANAAFDVLETTLSDLGIPLSELEDVRLSFDEALDSVEQALDAFPALVPIPLIGGSIEISVPLLVVDGIRLCGGFLTDRAIRGIASTLFGVEVPRPLFDVEFDVPGFTGAITGDLGFSSWIVAAELTKRLDFLVGAVEFGAGVHLVRGDLTPRIEVDVPPELESGISDALDALHLDGLHWSAFGSHVTVGLEVGPPFFRLHGDVRFALSLSSASGWWEMRLGELMATIGVVIRF